MYCWTNKFLSQPQACVDQLGFHRVLLFVFPIFPATKKRAQMMSRLLEICRFTNVATAFSVRVSWFDFVSTTVLFIFLDC